MEFNTEGMSTFEMTKEQLDMFIKHFKRLKLKTLRAIEDEFKNEPQDSVIFGIGQFDVDLSTGQQIKKEPYHNVLSKEKQNEDN